MHMHIEAKVKSKLRIQGVYENKKILTQMMDATHWQKMLSLQNKRNKYSKNDEYLSNHKYFLRYS